MALLRHHYTIAEAVVGAAIIPMHAYRCSRCNHDFHIGDEPKYCPECGVQFHETLAFGAKTCSEAAR
jgi:rubrerythrin